MSVRSSGFKRCTLALAISALSVQLVHAEDENKSDKASSVKVDNVVVLGEKQEKNLQDLPTSVALLTDEQIADSTIQNFNDVFSRMANVASLRGGNESLFSIRGISVQGLSDNPNSFTAGVYVDEVPLDNLSIRYGSMPIWDVQQIEVYRGPHSTIQGRNALNGAVIIKTQDPTYENSGKVRAEYGSFNTQRLSAAGGGAIIDEELAYRLSIDDHKSDGFVENITRNEDDYAGFHRTTYRGKVLFEPKALDQLRALLTVSKVDNDSGDNPNVRLDDPFSFEAQSNHNAYHNVDTDTAALDISWEFSDSLKLTSVSTYAKDRYDRLDDFDSSVDPLGFIDQKGGSEAFSQEFRVNFKSDDWSGVAGVYYGSVDRDGDWFLNTAYPKEGFENTIINTAVAQGLPLATANAIFAQTPNLINAEQDFDSNYEIENYAVFGEATWKATDKLALTFGARYDKEDQKRDQTTVTDVTTTVQVVDQITGAIDLLLNSLEQSLQGSEKVDTDYDAFLPKFAAQYYFTPDLNAGFSAQKGYRAGGSVVNLLTSQVHEFDPEYTWNYELSLRSQWLDQRLTVNANVFYTEWLDQQVDVSPSGDSRDKYTDNAGRSTISGAELETVAFVTPSLEVFANVGYVETEYNKFTLLTNDGLEDYKGNEFIGAPNWTANTGATYRHQDGWFAGADANYSDESELDHENTRTTDARILLNAKVGYEALDWSVYLWGTNLTDREYIVQSYLQLDAAAVQDNATAGAPRMFGLTAQVDF